MRIGVTGAYGFIGSHLLPALENTPGCVAVPLERKSEKKFPCVEDFSNFVRDKDLIYHLAGVNRGTGEEIVQGNVVSTFRLMEAIRLSGKPIRIIFISSSQVYKISGGKKSIRESDVTEPSGLYGVCKKAAEDMIRLSGLPYTLLRLSNVFGPGCRPNYNSVVATFCERAVNKLPLNVNGDGSQGRDFVYIDDAVRALLLAGMGVADSKSGTFNISSGKMVTVRQLLQAIKRFVPEVQVVFNREADAGGASYCCDNSRFMKQYGWKPKITFSKGIAETLLWLRSKV